MSTKYRFTSYIKNTETFTFFVDVFNQITAIFHIATIDINSIGFSGNLTFSDRLAKLEVYDDPPQIIGSTTGGFSASSLYDMDYT